MNGIIRGCRRSNYLKILFVLLLTAMVAIGCSDDEDSASGGDIIPASLDNSIFYGTYKVTFTIGDCSPDESVVVIGNDSSKSSEEDYIYIPQTSSSFASVTVEKKLTNSVSGNTISVHEEASDGDILNYDLVFSDDFSSLTLNGTNEDDGSDGCSGAITGGGVKDLVGFAETASKESICFFSDELEDEELEWGIISDSTPVVQRYNFVTKGWRPVNIETEYHDYHLTTQGWKHLSEYVIILESNSDGSMVVADSRVREVRNQLTLVDTVDLSSATIKNFLSDNGFGTASLLYGTEAFSTGAKAYRVDITLLDDMYELDYDSGDNGCPSWTGMTPDQAGGNCSVTFMNSKLEFAPSFDDFLTESEYVPSEETINDLSATSKIFDDGHEIVLEIVDDSVKTVNYYLMDFRSGFSNRTYTYLANSNWEYIVPTGLSEPIIMMPPFPEAVKSHSAFINDPYEGTPFFAEYQGWVRNGEFFAAGSKSERILLLNRQAINDIVDNLDFSLMTK